MTTTTTTNNAAGASQPVRTLTIGEALKACKHGRRITRWSHTAFVFLLTGMHRFPDSARSSHITGIPADLFEHIDPTTPQKHLPHGANTRAPMLCLVQAKVITEWHPTASDLLATDWIDLDAIDDPRPAWQVRVHDEADALSEKLIALTAFIDEAPTFAKLHDDEQARLRAQSYAMAEYHRILRDRIDAFTPQP